MKDIVYRPVDVDVIGHIMLHKFKVLAVQMRDIGHRAGEQTIHADDLVAAAKEIFAEMRPDKEPEPPVTRQRFSALSAPDIAIMLLFSLRLHLHGEAFNVQPGALNLRLA